MKLYFSGVSGKAEYDMLLEAGVDKILVDPADLVNVNGFKGSLALDSGAYRAFKQGKPIDMAAYINFAKKSPYDFRVMVDVIGDPFKTHQNWIKTFKREGLFIPVWQWGASSSYLIEYFKDSPIVGVGGLVQLMRDKDENMLKQLKSICTLYPGRLHIFGINWLKAIEELKSLVYSGDTSKFLDGGRYGHLIFKNTKTGHLSQAPTRALGLNLDRRQRIVESARNMRLFVAE